MKKMLFVILIGLFLSGCASTPIKPQTESKKSLIFSQPVEKTQKAVIDALVVLGFDIKKSEPLYVEGVRPRKIGLFVGSGGETMGIWLESLEANKTRVLVSTAKSFVGMAGQRNWDDEILTEMKRNLSKE